jgi:uncharacterized protein
VATDLAPLVLCDAGPLIALAKIGRLDLLKSLFGGVTATSVVWAEATAVDRLGERAALMRAKAHKWLKVSRTALTGNSAPNVLASDSALFALDAGELQTLSFAAARTTRGQSVLVVVDDRNARRAAAIMQVPHIGTVGVLLLAKQQKLIKKLRPELDALLSNSYFLSATLVSSALGDAGE